MSAIDNARAALAKLDDYKRTLEGRVSADDLADALRALMAEHEHLTAVPTDEALFDVIDHHLPMEAGDYCFCGATWGAAHLVAALAGDREEFGVFERGAFQGPIQQNRAEEAPK